MSRVVGMAGVNGARLYYECKGSGNDVLVLLRDGLLDSRIWDDQFEVFALRYRTIRYDARGHGRSEVAAGTYSDVNDLLGVLTFLGG